MRIITIILILAFCTVNTSIAKSRLMDIIENSEYLHLDRKERIRAVETTSDQSALVHVAMNDKEEIFIRTLAIKKINNQRVLLDVTRGLNTGYFSEADAKAISELQQRLGRESTTIPWKFSNSGKELIWQIKANTYDIGRWIRFRSAAFLRLQTVFLTELTDYANPDVPLRLGSCLRLDKMDWSDLAAMLELGQVSWDEAALTIAFIRAVDVNDCLELSCGLVGVSAEPPKILLRDICVAGIEAGEEEKLSVLVFLLFTSYDNTTLANLYLNSGNEVLSSAAYACALMWGYTVNEKIIWMKEMQGSPKWGVKKMK